MSDSPVAIVTGGAQGIGAAISRELVKKGYRVCVADIQESIAEQFVKEQLINGKENVTFMRCDVTKESDYTSIFKRVLEKFGRIDVLVNNAGIIDEIDPRKCLEVNLLGPLLGCHTALKFMGKSNGGNGGFVINTGSVAGFIPVAAVPAYIASKHGIIGLTRSFGLPFHYDKNGIMFAALCPALVKDTFLLRSYSQTLVPSGGGSHNFKTVSLELVVGGVLKLLEDKINGSTLIVVPEGYHYQTLEENLKTLICESDS